MFELGSSLREARRRRGLEIDAVQRATRIRRRYLEAIEEDRFEQLPGGAYTRGFLREYAEFLGLDGGLYVQEYNERFAPSEETTIAPVPEQPFHRRRSGLPTYLVAGLVLLALAAALAAWRLGGGSGKTTSPPAPATTATPPVARTKPKTTTKAAPKKPPPKPARLVLSATRGDCWLSVRLGSAAGKVVYENTLHTGSRLVFGLSQPLWIRVGDGHNLDASVAGKAIALPTIVGDVLVRPPSS
jgi:cytoskeleton protein RodZ